MSKPGLPTSEEPFSQADIEKALSTARKRWLAGETVDWKELNRKFATFGFRVVSDEDSMTAYLSPGYIGLSYIDRLCDVVWNTHWDGITIRTKNRSHHTTRALCHDIEACLICKVVGTSSGWSFGTLSPPSVLGVSPPPASRECPARRSRPVRPRAPSVPDRGGDRDGEDGART